MLKLKRFSDSEATILNMVEEQSNTNIKTQNQFGRGQCSTAKAGIEGKGRMGALLARRSERSGVYRRYRLQRRRARKGSGSTVTT